MKDQECGCYEDSSPESGPTGKIVLCNKHTPKPVMLKDLDVGDRVIFKEEVHRYPHFIVPKGASGLVVSIEYAVKYGLPAREDMVNIKIDQEIQGMDEWDNIFQYHPNCDDYSGDVELEKVL